MFLIARIAGPLVLGLSLCCLPPAAAQATDPRSPASLVGFWLVTIDGEPSTRTLIVSEEAPTANGALLAAKYGISEQGQSTVEARVLREGTTRQISLTTQASSVIAAVEQPDGTFKGTFTFRNGNVRGVIITRISEAEASALKTRPRDLSQPIPPGPGVPTECAAFAGTWAGSWTQGNFGELFLRVVEVKVNGGKCIARYSFTSSKVAVPAPYSTDIESNSMSFICNRSTQGTCQFKRSGDELWGSYSSTAGQNSGVFRRVATPSK